MSGLVGIDTNVLLRALFDDDPTQSPRAKAALQALSIDRPGLITSVTLAETYWFMARVRRLPKSRCLDTIRSLTCVDAFEFDDGEGVVRALELAEAGADFPDALIHGRFEQFGVSEAITFDRAAAEALGWSYLG